MRKLNTTRGFSPFRIGDPLFEVDRLRVDPAAMKFMDNELPSIFSGLEKEQQAVKDMMEDAFKQHDYGTLFDGLEFLKFSRFNAEKIVGIVSTTAGFLSAVGAVVAAVEAVSKVLDLLGITDAAEFDVQKALEEIGAKVNEIYGYLEQNAVNDLYEEAGTLRAGVGRVKEAVQTAMISASEDALDELSLKADELDRLIDKMLLVPNGNVPFSMQTYSQTSNPHALWFSVSGTPFLKKANGESTTKLSGISALVWDPGHYIDILAAAIRLRLVVATTLEPLYRSTGYRRSNIESIIPSLRTFLDHWRASMMVADPSACVLSDGTLANYDPNKSIVPGIYIGAVCPVTGVSSLRLFDGFAKSFHWDWSPFASGRPADRCKATDQQQAIKDALIHHAPLVDRVIKASGLYDFERLYRELRELASAPMPSESVRFSSVRRVPLAGGPWAVQLPSPGTPETVDLGPLKRWAKDPNKTYPAKRHFTSGGKVVTLYLGRRSVRSKIRLGYKLQIDEEVIEITEWGTQPAPDASIDWFPTAPIEKELRLRKKVYDCIQSRNLTAIEEENFDESGDSGGAQRLLLNERTADVTVKVRVEFDPVPDDGDPNPYLGEVKVFFEASDPHSQSASFILDVDILETHIGTVDPPVEEEVIVQGLNLHIVPSYLIVGSDFFEDYWDAFTRMLQAKVAAIYAASKHRLDLQDLPTEVDPSPKFLTVAAAKEIELSKQLFVEFERHPVIATELERHILPGFQR